MPRCRTLHRVTGHEPRPGMSGSPFPKSEPEPTSGAVDSPGIPSVLRHALSHFLRLNISERATVGTGQVLIPRGDATRTYCVPGTINGRYFTLRSQRLDVSVGEVAS